MVAQLKMFDTSIYILEEYKKKRCKYPSYVKVFCPYAYDHTKYRKLYKKIIAKAIKEDNPDVYYNTNPYDLIEQCIYRNKDGTKKHLGYEKHIFRYKSLYNIYKLIGMELANNQLRLELDFE